MNVKPQLTEMARKTLDKLATRVTGGNSHPDGPVTFTNVQVERKGNIMAFVIDLDKIAERGGENGSSGTGKPCTSKEGEVKEGPNKGQARGGNLMLATLNERIAQLPLGVLGGDFDVRCNLNLTIQPHK